MGQYFLKLDGITGESLDSNHPGEIEVESFSWGASNLGASHHGTGAGTGRANVQDFVVQKTMDKSSAQLFLNCCTGKPIAKGIITGRKAGGEQEKFIEYTLTDVLISSINTSGHDGTGQVPVEHVTLNFTKVEIDYLTQDAKGKTTSAGKKFWDQKQNKGG